MPQRNSPLDLPLQFVRGVGPRKAEAFEKSNIFTLRDLFYTLPRRYLDRSSATKIGELIGPTDHEVTIIGTIVEARPIRMKGGRERFEAILDDGSGQLILVWFHKVNQIRKWIKPDYTAAFHGKVNQFGARLQIAHPDATSLAKGEIQDLLRGEGRWIALYPGSSDLEKVGLDSRGLRNLIDRVVGEYLPMFDGEEVWPEEWRKKLELATLRRALEGVHRPKSGSDIQQGLKRLKFDELFNLQLLWAWTRRASREKAKGIAYEKVGDTTRELIEKRLPFDLTKAQKRVLREMWSDMQQPWPMSRLLQGDVGSGKTVVALIAMTIAVENGWQAALMAPTEILAEQHYLTSRGFLEGLGVHVELLTGSAKSAARREKLAHLSSGRPCIVIGTHALIQDAVNLPRLGLTVIDEQHRFGVAQRLKLMDPGGAVRPDVLVMTATPIPRSLSLALYGELEVSRLDEMPPGRGKMTTTAINGDTDRTSLYAGLRKLVLEQKARAYVVFPLVAESEKVDLKAAVEGRDQLLEGPLKGIEVGLLHGRMSIEEKEEAMRRFSTGETPVLVATTVVEVGVDVPEATEMIVEHAERFGLAQLHQLRGRVGRGGRDGHCWLVGYPPVTETARARLKMMVATTDGFQIAEEDLRIRGAGDMFGVRQSGMPTLRFADIVEDQGLLMLARKTADELLASDPKLESLPKLKTDFETKALRKAAWLEVG